MVSSWGMVSGAALAGTIRPYERRILMLSAVLTRFLLDLFVGFGFRSSLVDSGWLVTGRASL